jgi:hypothetical protein
MQVLQLTVFRYFPDKPTNNSKNDFDLVNKGSTRNRVSSRNETFTFSNGDRYYGAIVDKTLSGYGEIHFSKKGHLDMIYFIGNFSNNKKKWTRKNDMG